MKAKRDTSWQNVNKWYSKNVGLKGNYYHKTVVIPGVLRMLRVTRNDSILDLACGQGVLSRHIDKEVKYVGVDYSTALIEEAKKLSKNKNWAFETRNLSNPINLSYTKFSIAVCILAAQNIENVKTLFENASRHVIQGGKFLIVLNHPCFRIPRHSGWDFDEKGNIMYRRVDQYMSNLNIPILSNPSKGESSEKTVSFHRPLSFYINTLSESGFCISKLEEWVSDKESLGKRSKAENTARREIPLFMAVLAKKS